MSKRKISPKKDRRPTRLRRNIEEATPVSQTQGYVHAKPVYTLQEACALLECSYNTLKARVRAGLLDLNMDGPPKKDARGRLSIRGATVAADEIDRCIQRMRTRIARAS